MKKSERKKSISSTPIVGWDIGGAHLKAVELCNGKVQSVHLQPCPLWKGVEQLHWAMGKILPALTYTNSHHAVTMTGEMVDSFAQRMDGVKTILQAVNEQLPPSKIRVYAGRFGFLKLQQIEPKHYSSIASANWLASVEWLAQRIDGGVFIDCGSTTTDILLFDERQLLIDGFDDYQRLVSRELVYTGIVRTAVMAVTQTVNDQGQSVGVMAEYFATMADVYRLTGELNEAHDHTEAADGAEKTIQASARRLARMIGCDANLEELHRWRLLAFDIRKQQCQQIKNACEQRLAKYPLSPDKPLIGAGVGRFLVQEIASALGRPYCDIQDLLPVMIPLSSITMADCIPAGAVAHLAEAQWNSQLDDMAEGL